MVITNRRRGGSKQRSWKLEPKDPRSNCDDANCTMHHVPWSPIANCTMVPHRKLNHGRPLQTVPWASIANCTMGVHCKLYHGRLLQTVPWASIVNCTMGSYCKLYHEPHLQKATSSEPSKKRYFVALKLLVDFSNLRTFGSFGTFDLTSGIK